MLLRKFCLGNNFSMNIKENTYFLLQRPRQLGSAKMIFKDRRNVFCNVNLSNLGNLLQRNVRTGRVRKCIFRASGDKFCKIFSLHQSWLHLCELPVPVFTSLPKKIWMCYCMYTIYIFMATFL